MRDKTSAAKELLERGWTLDEVIRALEPTPAPPQFIPYLPPLETVPNTPRPWWQPAPFDTITYPRYPWRCDDTVTTDKITLS
jgi:hypothetical protein